MLDHTAFLDLLERELATYRSTLATADLSAEVAACPGWSVTELTRHLGSVHRWSGAIVASGESVPWPEEGDQEGEELKTWFAESNEILLDALRNAEPDAGTWTLIGPAAKSFWFRRQAQEALVHRIDLERALGTRTPSDVALAADGIQEIWDVMMPRIVKRGIAGEILAPVTIHATDADRSWTLKPGHEIEDGDSGVARIEGPAESLLLLLWQRLSPNDPSLTLSGDQAALDSVTGGRLTP